MAENPGVLFKPENTVVQQYSATTQDKQGRDVSVTRDAKGGVAVQISSEINGVFENTHFEVQPNGKASAGHLKDTDAPGTASAGGLSAEKFVNMNSELVRQVAAAIKNSGSMLDKQEATQLGQLVSNAIQSGTAQNNIKGGR